ncbi:MAG TPA: glutaredoxin family protein [Bacillota bacterium]
MSRNGQGDIVVYTQPGCAPCAAAKEFLASQGIEFVERNIREDPSALAELRRLGAMATPTITIGEAVVVGFDRERLAQLLELDA